MIEDFLRKHSGKVLIIVVLSTIGIASAIIFGSDNAIEEGAESVIKSQTGLDIDLTPKSIEK